ncbi:MAG TPA: hypothetical protein VHS31_12505 [Tepidisphaeraceae bacterium]|jgi:ribosomal protein L37AE/L43A|nr:hypothetical protein [Tepidisphaeraceae bacterium]
MAEAAGHISVLCGCGKKLKAPASAVGRKAKCPSCGNVLTIEAPPPPPPAAPEEDDPFGALYDLAEAEKKAAVTNQVDDSPRCPKCGTSMGSGAVLCVNCGYDLRSKSKVTAKPVQAGKPILDLESAKTPKKNKDKMAPQGSFMAGLGLSVALGAVGGLIWFLVTWFTDWDFVFLSVLIGALAGAGMKMGQKGFSKLGGWAAMGVTFAIVFLARSAVVVAVLVPMIRHSASTLGGSSVSADDDDPDDREQVVDHYADQELKNMGANLDHPSEAQEKAAMVVAVAKVKKMTPAQIKAEVEREDAADEAANNAAEKTMEATGANTNSNSQSPSNASSGSAGGKAVVATLGLVVILWAFLGGWFGIICMVAALAAAYKGASGVTS